MSAAENNWLGKDLEGIIGNATDYELEMVAEAAEVPYIQHVLGRIVSGKPINHEVTDWHEEMRRDIKERFPLTDELADLAITCCEATIRSEEPKRG